MGPRKWPYHEVPDEIPASLSAVWKDLVDFQNRYDRAVAAGGATGKDAITALRMLANLRLQASALDLATRDYRELVEGDARRHVFDDPDPRSRTAVEAVRDLVNLAVCEGRLRNYSIAADLLKRALSQGLQRYEESDRWMFEISMRLVRILAVVGSYEDIFTSPLPVIRSWLRAQEVADDRDVEDLWVIVTVGTYLGQGESAWRSLGLLKHVTQSGSIRWMSRAYRLFRFFTKCGFMKGATRDVLVPKTTSGWYKDRAKGRLKYAKGFWSPARRPVQR